VKDGFSGKVRLYEGGLDYQVFDGFLNGVVDEGFGVLFGSVEKICELVRRVHERKIVLVFTAEAQRFERDRNFRIGVEGLAKKNGINVAVVAPSDEVERSLGWLDLPISDPKNKTEQNLPEAVLYFLYNYTDAKYQRRLWATVDTLTLLGIENFIDGVKKTFDGRLTGLELAHPGWQYFSEDSSPGQVQMVMQRDVASLKKRSEV
jgi:hypothetical protein